MKDFQVCLTSTQCFFYRHKINFYSNLMITDFKAIKEASGLFIKHQQIAYCCKVEVFAFFSMVLLTGFTTKGIFSIRVSLVSRPKAWASVCASFLMLK